MIVDMVRNDLGRIALPGTVEVPRLFDVERHRTVLQMVSEIEAVTEVSLSEILTALFPAASITGAPKASTMSWIRRLEEEPRGIYTGAIGTVRPGRQVDFSVAIRTAHIDRRLGRIEYGTGGGIVWDSKSAAEWAETRTKALILAAPEPEFRLLETLRWEPGSGFHLLDLHLDRLVDSAAYFDFRCDRSAVRAALETGILRAGPPPAKRIVRLLLAETGETEVEVRPLESAPWRIGVALEPVSSGDRFLFHKTTQRRVYERAIEGRPECDDVLLWNERREWTESTRANLVVVIDGVSFTPPTDAGLLAGTEREQGIRSGRLVERTIHDHDLLAAEAAYLLNSVRGRIDIDLARLAEEVRRLRAPVTEKPV